jgi:hypothetical protein
MIKFLGTTYALETTPTLLPNGTVIVSMMEGGDLLTTYNLVASNLGKGRVNRFADRKTAVRRLWAILQEYAAQDAQEEAPAPQPEPVAAPATEQPKVTRKKRGMRFVFPAESDIKEVRPGSARAIALACMQREGGATFEEIMEATGWNEKKAYEGIRLVHYYVGYGMKQDAEGRITVHR